ncbi:ComEC/Rec2 family competence protein [Candidatus Saccharibacteria bacterium]|nr:ComEC/Rec2 family competence protein [Candidatus Saccharibacteria bacterium]
MLKWLSRQVHQSWLVVFLCVGVVAGVIVGMVMWVNYFASPVWIGLVVVMLVVAYLKPRCAVVVLALVAGMVLAFVKIANELVGEDYVRRLYGYEIVVTGVVEGDPETDEGVTKFKLGNLQFGEEEVESTGSIYVTVSQNEELAREDKVVLSGKMLDGFGTYAGYMYRPKLVKWERPEPGSWVLAVRNWFAGRVRSMVPEPEVKLGLSYLLGLKTGLPDELDENLRVVGLTHIVVASGAHLAILVGVARKLFGKLSRFAGVLFAVLFVVFFMAMVGWTPSILRAGMMTILTLVAWYSGREVAAWRLILMVAAVTLMMQPSFIINMGWQLSFASYAGIMILGSKMIKFFYGVKKPGFVGSMVITTMAATVMTLPIILYYYGAVSLISVVANILILPTLPWAMGLVFATGVVANVPMIGMMVGWCATKLLDYHIAVIGWFGGMREFLVEIPKYQGWVFVIYIVIIVLLFLSCKKRFWKKIMI